MAERFDPGKLDQRVTILQRVNVRNSKTGTDKANWTPLATVWAEVIDVLPAQAGRLVDVIDIDKRPCRVRLRYRSDITAAMRLRINDDDYRIVSGPAQLGRREGLELLVALDSTLGQRP